MDKKENATLMFEKPPTLLDLIIILNERLKEIWEVINWIKAKMGDIDERITALEHQVKELKKL